MAYSLRLVGIALTSCLLIFSAAQLDDPAVNLPGCHITIVFPRHSFAYKVAFVGSQKL